MRKDTQHIPTSPSDFPHFITDIEVGLNHTQVQERISAGLYNITPPTNTKSEGKIIKENTLTFFNFIFLILASLLIMVGSFKNLTFLMVAIINTVIGIYQELRAKRAVDALTLVATATIAVLRDGKKSLIPSDKLVQDDIVEFSAGQQICADAVVRSGNILVNESLLTGESDAIEKSTGCELKSGSFVVSGRCLAQLTQVGVESYTAKLAAEARRNTRSTKSEMMRSLSKLIQVVGIALVPMGIMLFLRHYLDAFQGMDLRNSVEATVAALIGMIPEGLYLLTSIAIAASCLKLSKSRVLIQDMNCIETLARVDILCVDKTGTITEPGMEVEDVLPLSSRYSHDNIEEILAAFYHGEEPDNETAKAMSLQFDRNTDWSATQRLPFSSDTKWSGADFGSNGCYIIGAPEFIMATRYNEIQEKAELMSSRGCRVLLLASYGASLNKNLDISQLEPLALIFLSNFLRPDAKNTFRYFAQQGVSVRVISGDNPLTVSEIAQRAGILNAEKYIDATTLKTDEDYQHAAKNFTVFGRVTPEQKRTLIQAFQSQGHTVAMTGDGVNDVLALKNADVGIAMASGSDAASQISQIVLLDSQFSAMPEIVGEGRRVINNIQRSSSLFLVKNIFSFAFTFLLLFVNLTYPLQAIQLSVIGSVTIGIPAFFLALEPNYARVKGKFLKNVIMKALPGGLTDFVMLLLIGVIGKILGFTEGAVNTISVYVIAFVGFVILYTVSVPFTKLRRVIFYSLIGIVIAIFLIFPRFLELTSLSLLEWGIAALLALIAPSVINLFLYLFRKSSIVTQK